MAMEGENKDTDSSSELCIMVSSTNTIRWSYQQLSSNSQGECKAFCTIAIPIQLPLEWNTNEPGLSFFSKANDHITNCYQFQT